MKDNIKNYLPCILAGVLLLISIIVFLSIKGGYEQEESDIMREIQAVQTKIDQSGEQKKAVEKEVKMEVSGLDTSRVQTDDKAAKDFFEDILSWSSYEEYQAVRERITNEYDLDDSSTLLVNFFPEIEVVTDPDGNEYNIIDAMRQSGEPLNLSFVDMSSYVINISGTDYSYFTEVTVSSTANNGGMATGRCIFLYTVSEDGQLSNLHAYTVAE